MQRLAFLFRKSYSHEFKSFNATAEHPVTDGCMWSYDPDYPEANFRKLESFFAESLLEFQRMVFSTTALTRSMALVVLSRQVHSLLTMLNLSYPQLFLQCPSLSLPFFCDHSFVLAPFKLITFSNKFLFIAKCYTTQKYLKVI